jgi:O-6-methylguanine DNA methyltransferase
VSSRLRQHSFCSPLGWIIAAATEHGIALLHFHGHDPPVEAETATLLESRFPEFHVGPGESSPLLAEAQEAVLKYLTDGARIPDLPLDLTKGTLFQMKVWQALRDIPYGETLSYSEVSRTIGRPGSARAVGAACGANPVAIIVPCHRVVSANGRLGGYSAGLQIKRTLLDIERGRLSGSGRLGEERCGMANA